MKKCMALLFSLLLAASMTTGAFGASITALNGTDSKEVSGNYIPGSAQTVYSVDVSWGTLSFTYREASSGTWNPQTHSYSGTGEAAWEWTDESNIITVVNHSNTALDVRLGFTASASGITGGFYSATTNGSAIANNTLSLATAEGTAPQNAPQASAYLQITGGSISAAGKLGTVVVSLQ